MLGRDLVPMFQQKGHVLHCVDVDDLDLTKENDVHQAIRSCMPDFVINCAAYTEVDKAESEKERAFAVNRDGARYLAQACEAFDIPLFHLSTDYVFDGKERRPYLEDDPVNPLNTYGLSKWEGEQAVRSCLEQHIIIRTSWLFGANGRNFVKTVLRLASERDELQVVADQEGCPTWTGDLSNALTCLAREIFINKKGVPWGTYHFCGKGNTTWYDFAVCIMDEAEKRGSLRTTRVKPIQTSSYPTAATRPAWSVLDCGKIEYTFQIYPRPWLEGLHKVLDELLCDKPS